jgi:hypothetical protein
MICPRCGALYIEAFDVWVAALPRRNGRLYTSLGADYIHEEGICNRAAQAPMNIGEISDGRTDTAKL